MRARHAGGAARAGGSRRHAAREGEVSRVGWGVGGVGGGAPAQTWVASSHLGATPCAGGRRTREAWCAPSAAAAPPPPWP
jgi:hypothetical protein